MDSINFNAINVLNIVTLFVTLLFVFQIYFLKKRTQANTFFACYLLAIAFILVFFLVLDLNFNIGAYALLPLLLLGTLSIGPILWIYVKLVTGHELQKLKKHLYLPLGLSGITLLLVIADGLVVDKEISKVILTILNYLVLTCLTAVFLIQNGYYIISSYKLYRSHVANLGHTYSYTEKVNLSWFRLLIYGYIFFILGLILSHLVDDSISYVTFYGILLVYVIYAGYNALNQDPVFLSEEDKKEDNGKLQYDASNEVFVALKEALESYMSEEKPYLNSSLTIHNLASELTTNSRYLSQLINKEYEKNFVSFINEYRIEEAKRLLLDPENEHLTIESIGYDSGFKSKSAFNAAFKKIVGETPSVFKRNMQ